MSLPPSSPRLPSPPPPTEIQIGPKSPSLNPNATRQAQQIEQTAIDANAKRRIHPGTKAADMAAGPPLVPLHELDSAFQLQEHLAALHYYHTVSNTSPITREAARILATPPPNTDKTLWLYELCRFLIAQCNSLIIGFLFDTPPCSAATCPEMRASEWQFLCAVHEVPKSCCAIDYCCHTLDWAANVVTNPKIFPSRFVVHHDAHDKTTALRNLVNVFRRLHRIFAHAWFQHRGVFWSIEGQTGLYVFFKTVCDVYDLLPAENYKLPPEAEGLEDTTASTGVSITIESSGSAAERKQQQQHAAALSTINKMQSSGPRSGAAAENTGEDDGFNSNALRTNTRRHIKSSPSVGSAVTTVLEADEDDSSPGGPMVNMMVNHSKFREPLLNLPPAPAPPSYPGSGALVDEDSIPVIVEHSAVDQPPARPSSVIPISGSAAASAATSSESQKEKHSVSEATSPQAKPDTKESTTESESISRRTGEGDSLTEEEDAGDGDTVIEHDEGTSTSAAEATTHEPEPSTAGGTNGGESTSTDATTVTVTEIQDVVGDVDGGEDESSDAESAVVVDKADANDSEANSEELPFISPSPAATEGGEKGENAETATTDSPPSGALEAGDAVSGVSENKDDKESKKDEEGEEKD